MREKISSYRFFSFYRFLNVRRDMIFEFSATCMTDRVAIEQGFIGDAVGKSSGKSFFDTSEE